MYEQHYAKNSVVLFDGYPETNTIVTSAASTLNVARGTKNAERLRRKNYVWVLAFEYQSFTKIPFSQEFLKSNVHFKNKFIQTLMEKLQTRHFCSVQAEEDSDALIIETAIEIKKNNSTNGHRRGARYRPSRSS